MPTLAICQVRAHLVVGEDVPGGVPVAGRAGDHGCAKTPCERLAAGRGEVEREHADPRARDGGCRVVFFRQVALLRKSFVALYGERDPRAGLELTTHAAEATTGDSHVLTGLAILHAAEAHAVLGQLKECEP